MEESTWGKQLKIFLYGAFAESLSFLPRRVKVLFFSVLPPEDCEGDVGRQESLIL